MGIKEVYVNCPACSRCELTPETMFSHNPRGVRGRYLGTSLRWNRFHHWFYFLAISNKYSDIFLHRIIVFYTFTSYIGMCCTEKMYRSRKRPCSKVMTFGEKIPLLLDVPGKINSKLKRHSFATCSSQYPQCRQFLVFSPENLFIGCLLSSGSSMQLSVHH